MYSKRRSVIATAAGAKFEPPLSRNPIGLTFEPDTLRLSQYVETIRQGPYLSPEKALLLAILEDAVDCFQKHAAARGEKQKKLIDEAKSWILQEDRNWPMSFVNICEIFGIHPHYLRSGLMAWKERKLSGSSRTACHRVLNKRQTNQQKKGDTTYGQEKRNVDHGERNTGRRQPELIDSRAARSAARPGLAAFRKARPL
jgi:hypothetical protein